MDEPLADATGPPWTGVRSPSSLDGGTIRSRKPSHVHAGGAELPSVVRAEREAFEWTPVVRRDGDEGDDDEAKGVDRRDRYRQRMSVGATAAVEG